MSIVKIDILNHADYCAAFNRDKEAPGIASFYTAIESIRSKNKDYTLLLDAGDNFKSLLWDDKVQDGIKILREDVYNFGNHDFDFGKEHLEAGIKKLEGITEVISSNVIEKETGTFVKGAKPYVILDKGGIKIGILGLITEYTPYMVTYTSFLPYKVIDSEECTRKYVKEMRDKGAEVIVLLTHHPFYFTEDSESGELIELLDKVEDLHIDAAIGGHIPGDYARVYKGCATTKGGFGGYSLPHIMLYFDTESRKVINKECEVIDVYNGDYPDDPVVKEFETSVVSKYDWYINDVIGEAIEKIPMRLDFESPMGNLLADMIKWYFKTDFVYFNNTSCGTYLEKGPITRNSINDITHFNDHMYVGKMTGKLIWDLFEHVHEPERFGNNGNISFAGFIVKMNHNNKSPNKVISITNLDGSEFDLNKTYSVATSEYMAYGGNGTKFISNQINFEKADIRIQDMIALYVKEFKELKCPELGRYPFIGKPENDNSPW